MSVSIGVKINPPTLLIRSGGGSNYERYKQELSAWREVTDLAKGKRGLTVALSLPADSKIREQVFEELKIEDLKKDDGLDTLIKFLDEKLGKDELEDSLEKFEDFESYQRGANETIAQYIDNFDQKYGKIEKKDMKMPSAILAFKLLRKAMLTKEERLLVLTGMDFSKKDTMYHQAKQSLKKFKGEVVSDSSLGATGSTGSAPPAIKLEPVLATSSCSEDEVFMNWRGRGSFRRGQGFRGFAPSGRSSRGGGQHGYPNSSSQRGFSNSSGQRSQRGYVTNSSQRGRGRTMNPVGDDGNPITCHSCGSFRHLVKDCPHSWEKVNFVEDEVQHAVLFTGDKAELLRLGLDARGSAVLDSACTSTVCGKTWFQDYLQSLNEADRARVHIKEGSRIFRFGGGTKLKSVSECEIPVVLAGEDVALTTDVVESDIPLLLSKDAMKKAGIKLDMVSDTAQIFGKEVPLDFTSSGHYCVPIDRNQGVKVEDVCAVNLSALTPEKLDKTILKLHRQFGHPSEKKFVALLKDAGAWRESYRDSVSQIYQHCEICRIYAKTPPRPVVAMPMASRFNEKVAMDLKKWDDRWILHMIDMFSRLTVSVFINRKHPSAVIDKIMTHWVGTFGVMEAVLTDNGGEFNAEEIREVASILGVEVLTTGAESPFQNGLCERVHATTDNILTKLLADEPNKPAEVLLSWANMARNSLQMWHGYSSYQLVFGKNPNLPNIMTDSLPAWEGTTTSDIFARHLNALHATRQAYIQSESDERIRRALRSKVRCSEQIFQNGDRVFYKREGKDRWLGPGKVVFQDGKVVFVRHGGTFVRVSPTRLVKVGLSKSDVDATISVNNFAQQNPTTASSADTPQQVQAEIISDEENRLEPVVVHAAPPVDVAPEPDLVSETQDPEENPILPMAHRSQNSSNSDDSTIKLCSQDRIQCKLPETNQWTDVTVLSRAGKVTGKNKTWFNVMYDNGEQGSVNLDALEWRKTEDVNVSSASANHDLKGTDESAVLLAKATELQKLKDFDAYDIIKLDANMKPISTRWVVTKKGSETRARLVARGFEEKSDSFPKDSPTVTKSSLRIFLSVTASFQWCIQTTDIKSAFLQSRPFDREVFIVPPVEANVPDGYVWKLKRCLYGLNDAARQFYLSVDEELAKLGCKKSQFDPSLFFFRTGPNDTLSGIIVTHIDDFLHAGSNVFDMEVMIPLRHRFQAGKLVKNSFRYIGFDISQDRDGILLDQNSYVQSIDSVLPERNEMKDKDAPLSPDQATLLRSLAGRINWAVQGTRPDVAFELTEISTKFKKGTVKDLLRVRKVVRRLQSDRCQILFPDLGPPEDWQIIVFTDAAHANLSDGVSSMGSHIVFLVGRNYSSAPIIWSGSKIKRVVRSTLAAEALSLQVGLEGAFYVKAICQELLHIDTIPVNAYTDNKSLMDAVYSTKLVDDKRLRIDLAAIKEAICAKDIYGVRWCPGSQQLADCMTKHGASPRQLLLNLYNGQLNINC